MTAWDIDADSGRFLTAQRTAKPRRPPKQVHYSILSMPAKTDANKLLAACRVFARENFALKHRYAMVLHTDQAHPHVHLVVKAASEQGVRLNIRKATLREWREQFAGQLRSIGVAANASPRAVRGLVSSSAAAGVEVAGQSQVQLPATSSKAQSASPLAVTQWRVVARILARSREQGLADEVERYAAGIGIKPEIRRQESHERQR